MGLQRITTSFRFSSLPFSICLVFWGFVRGLCMCGLIRSSVCLFCGCILTAYMSICIWCMALQLVHEATWCRLHLQNIVRSLRGQQNWDSNEKQIYFPSLLCYLCAAVKPRIVRLLLSCTRSGHKCHSKDLGGFFLCSTKVVDQRQHQAAFWDEMLLVLKTHKSISLLLLV